VAAEGIDASGPTRFDHATDARTLPGTMAPSSLDSPELERGATLGRFGDQVFVAMEFVPGRTLSAWLAAADRP